MGGGFQKVRSGGMAGKQSNAKKSASPRGAVKASKQSNPTKGGFKKNRSGGMGSC